MSLIIINDYIHQFRSEDELKSTSKDAIYNIEKHAPWPVNVDSKGYIKIEDYKDIVVFNNRKDPINILDTDIKKDKFDRSYGQLQMAFCYPVFKKLLEDLNDQFPGVKIYCDLKRVYTNKPITFSKVIVKMFYNENKKTINIMLYPC
jgi:hypothetical protein